MEPNHIVAGVVWGVALGLYVYMWIDVISTLCRRERERRKSDGT